MKGIIIQKPLEVRLFAEGDSFCQGDTIRVMVTVKNHSAETQSALRVRLELVVAEPKKVKQRSAEAFTDPIAADTPTITLAPLQQQECSWSFNLPENCVVSHKAQSLYLLYGLGEGIPAGQLPVPVMPHPLLQKIFELMESAFQFVLRDISWSQGWVIGRFKASSARQYSLVEELSLKIQRQDGKLAVQYDFKVRRFDTEVSSVSVKRAKSVVEQLWTPAEYLLGDDHLNYEGVEQRLQEALKSVATQI
ncbi:MAG: hypothetical protein EBZ48_05560 [Proteobacteria bacterium]|nr:hypothetical protein [Pseudomonadota bacterium]